jgi:hypothetical protein
MALSMNGFINEPHIILQNPVSSFFMPPRLAKRLPVLLVIVAVHGVLIGLSDRLFQHAAPTLAQRLSTVSVWLPPLAGIFAIPDLSAPKTSSRQSDAAPARAHQTPAIDVQKAPVPLPAPTQTTGTQEASASNDRAQPATNTGAQSVDASPAPAVAPAAPLNLSLPRDRFTPKTAQAIAVERQIGGRQSLSVETRIAATLGPGQWTEERLDPDRIRFKNGNTCVTAQRARIDQLDPFYAREHPNPWQVGQREAC